MSQLSQRMTLPKVSIELPKLLNNKIPAWNVLITGPTGSGKTFLMESLLIKEYLECSTRPAVVYFSVNNDSRSQKSQFTRIVRPKEHKLNEEYRNNPFHVNFIEKWSWEYQVSEVKIRAVSKKISESIEQLDDRVEKTIREYYWVIQQDETDSRILKHKIDSETGRDSIILFFTRKNPEILLKIGIDNLSKILDLKPHDFISRDNWNRLKEFFEIILSSSDKIKDGFQQFDENEIKKLVDLTYASVGGRFPTLSDFYGVCKESCVSGAVDKLLARIYPWLKSESNPNAAFDTEEYYSFGEDDSDDAHLITLSSSFSRKDILFTLFMMKASDDFFAKHANKHRFEIFDTFECFIPEETLAIKVLDKMRTARKKGKVMCIITQSAHDLMHEPKMGQMFFQNFTNVFFMGGTRESAKTISQWYGVAEDKFQNLGANRKFDSVSKTIVHEEFRFLYINHYD